MVQWNYFFACLCVFTYRLRFCMEIFLSWHANNCTKTYFYLQPLRAWLVPETRIHHQSHNLHDTSERDCRQYYIGHQKCDHELLSVCCLYCYKTDSGRKIYRESCHSMRYVWRHEFLNIFFKNKMHRRQLILFLVSCTRLIQSFFLKGHFSMTWILSQHI